MAHDPVACAVASIVFAVVACFALSVRFFVRLGLQNRIFLDDILSAVATAIYIALSVQYTIGVFRDGVGKPESELSPAPYEAGKRTVLICQLLYFVSTYLIKLSFIFTLLRIVTERRYTYTLYVGIASGAVITILTWFWLLFFCNPISYFWRKQPSPDVQGHCKPLASLTILTIIHGSWILLADLTLGIVIPALLLSKLQMHPRSKLSVLGLLGLGSIAGIATIVRMVYLPNLTVHDALNTNNRVIFWSLIEVAINIIATATATWKPLMARWGSSTALIGSTQLRKTVRGLFRCTTRTGGRGLGKGGEGQRRMRRRWRIPVPLERRYCARWS
ncbi:hypothetical protein BDW75DRAFT_246300 [Aspergillus navahoensis]